MLAIAAGIFFGNIYLGVSLLVVLEWLAVAIVPTVMSASIAVVVTVIAGLMFWGGIKR